MSLSPRIEPYLELLGAAVPVRELVRDPGRPDLVALRHDIDHDLDLALELAAREHERGIRASYFLLHTSDYWDEPDFDLKCRQLQAYGHEVGLHLNLLAAWHHGTVDEPDAELREMLGRMREAGIEVTGTAAHGDRSCYENGFVNFWLWREIVSLADFGSALRNAEGIECDDGIAIPETRRLKRADGVEYSLGSSSMVESGIDYEAFFAPHEHYWSDSGGQWRGGNDPLDADLSRGRHQVLLHPYWWRGPQKLVFVLSAARSGSRWLATVVDRASSARGRHEWSLNHRRRGDDMVSEKITNDDYCGLVEDEQRSRLLLRESTSWLRSEQHDVLEANVYLEPFLQTLRRLAPDASLIHLVRDGREVIRSILGRGWYETPEDRRRRQVPIAEWAELSRLERAAWYWRFTQERIAPVAAHRLYFERMVADRDYLTTFLRELGITVHPLLLDEVFPQPVNATQEHPVPLFDEWPATEQERVLGICGATLGALGYDCPTPGSSPFEAKSHEAPRDDLPPLRLELPLDEDLGAKGVEWVRQETGWVLRVLPEAETNSWALVAAGSWRRLRGTGVPCDPGSWFRCRLEGRLDPGLQMRLFALFYDDEGRMVHQHRLADLREPELSLEASFGVALEAHYLTLAFHIGDPGSGGTLHVDRLQLERVPHTPGYPLWLERAGD